MCTVSTQGDLDVLSKFSSFWLEHAAVQLVNTSIDMPPWSLVWLLRCCWQGLQGVCLYCMLCFLCIVARQNHLGHENGYCTACLQPFWHSASMLASAQAILWSWLYLTGTRGFENCRASLPLPYGSTANTIFFRSCSSCWRSPYLSSKFWAASWHLEPRYHVQHISHLGLIDIMFGCEKTQWWWSWQASPQSAKFQNQSLISMWHTSMSYAAHCYNGVQVGLCLWLCNALLLQTQAHAPVNLITETYDHLEIRRHKDLESFVKHKQEQAWQLTKAKQASR